MYSHTLIIIAYRHHHFVFVLLIINLINFQFQTLSLVLFSILGEYSNNKVLSWHSSTSMFWHDAVNIWHICMSNQSTVHVCSCVTTSVLTVSVHMRSFSVSPIFRSCLGHPQRCQRLKKCSSLEIHGAFLHRTRPKTLFVLRRIAPVSRHIDHSC